MGGEHCEQTTERPRLSSPGPPVAVRSVSRAGPRAPAHREPLGLRICPLRSSFAFTMQSFRYAHLPAELSTVHVALFTNVTNSAALRARIVSASQLEGPDGDAEPSANSILGGQASAAELRTPTGEVGRLGWIRLETALRTLAKSSNLFPPLRSALDDLAACLEVLSVI